MGQGGSRTLFKRLLCWQRGRYREKTAVDEPHVLQAAEIVGLAHELRQGREPATRKHLIVIERPFAKDDAS